MSIPDYQTVMLPLLEYIKDDQMRSMAKAVEYMADKFNLTGDERNERLPSGQSTYIKNRTGWARTYLKKAGLLSSPQRGFIQITARGHEVLSENPTKIDRELLKRFPEFVEFCSNSKNDDSVTAISSNDQISKTPEEQIEEGFECLNLQLSDEILDQIKQCSPLFFERLVVDLLVAMGYGGTVKDAAQATQGSNDEGIDGIIKEDILGLKRIYIQAKRWQHPVHRPEIQKFAGALQGKRTRKGIFITTSSFSDGAKEYAGSIDSHIVCIDGQDLARLMIEHNVGVAPLQVKAFQLKRIDTDYFIEDI